MTRVLDVLRRLLLLRVFDEVAHGGHAVIGGAPRGLVRLACVRRGQLEGLFRE